MTKTKTLEYFPEEVHQRVRDELIPRLIDEGFLRIEVPARHLKTGQTFPALWTAFVIRESKTEKPVLLAAITRDLTTQKRDEDELRRTAAYLTAAQSISHTGSWAWNVTTGNGEWSQELYRILGLQPVSASPNPATYLERVVPEDRPEAERIWSEAIAGQHEFDHQHRIVRPDGTIRYVRRLGRPFGSANQELEFIGSVIDVTDLKAAQEQMNREVISLKEQNLLLKKEFYRDPMFKEIIGSSAALEATLAQVAAVAPTDSTVLITGETGTGKELIAHAIHRYSPRAEKAFISVNCAAILPSLIASELFGHEKGAFTGADQRRIGKFELADGGTLFLDEVGDIPAETQAMLLRVLQEREFERVGGNTKIRVDVRVLAATNRDLQLAIRANKFRNDLFYRLSVFPIEVPPLRERKEDIPTLVSYFVQLSARKLGKDIPEITRGTMARLQAFDWPGNIRELQNLIERSVIVSRGDILAVDERIFSTNEGRPSFRTYVEEMESHERQIIEDALEKSHGKVSGPNGAAAALGLPQSTLATRIAALKIDKHKFNTD